MFQAFFSILSMQLFAFTKRKKKKRIIKKNKRKEKRDKKDFIKVLQSNPELQDTLTHNFTHTVINLLIHTQL